MGHPDGPQTTVKTHQGCPDPGPISDQNFAQNKQGWRKTFLETLVLKARASNMFEVKQPRAVHRTTTEDCWQSFKLPRSQQPKKIAA